MYRIVFALQRGGGEERRIVDIIINLSQTILIQWLRQVQSYECNGKKPNTIKRVID